MIAQPPLVRVFVQTDRHVCRLPVRVSHNNNNATPSASQSDLQITCSNGFAWADNVVTLITTGVRGCRLISP